jgi:ferredoxin
MGVIALNLFSPRFWCRYLCPLGGLLGLISKFALFRRKVGPECQGCKLCTSTCPTGTIDPGKDYASDPSECTLCLDCLETCPRSLITFSPRFSIARWNEYDPGRRDAIAGLRGCGCGGGAVPQQLVNEKRASAPAAPTRRASGDDPTSWPSQIASAARNVSVPARPMPSNQPCSMLAWKDYGRPSSSPALATVTTRAMPAGRSARSRPSHPSTWRLSARKSSAKLISTRIAALPGLTSVTASYVRRCARCQKKPSSSKRCRCGIRIMPASP